MPKKIALYLSALFLLLSSCKGKNEEKKALVRENSINHIEGIVIKPAVLEETILVSGTLKPYEETTLMPETSGRTVEISFKEGMFVKKGTMLVQLYNDDLIAQQKKLEAQLEIAELTEKRQRELVEINGISKQEFDQTVLQHRSIQADIEIVKAQLRKTEIIAPFDGIIGLRNISLGAVVTPGTPLAVIREVNQLKLEFSFPGKYTNQVKKGTKIKFDVQGLKNEFEAEVIALEGGVDIETRNLKAKAIVHSDYPELVPGMYVNIKLDLKENENALMVPTQAIIPEARNKKLILSKKGKAHFVNVETGVRQASSIEIIHGIEPGDTVVTTGILFIKPGAVLKFDKID